VDTMRKVGVKADTFLTGLPLAMARKISLRLDNTILGSYIEILKIKNKLFQSCALRDKAGG